jgi:hypothetical protein
MVGLRGICFALVAGLALSACSNDSGMMNLRSATPDEFGVMPNKPLEMPDSFAQLPMPVPGAGNRADINPVAEGRAALGGRSPNAGGIPAADAALLATSQRYGITPDIRVVLAVEDAEWRAGNRGRLLDRWLNKNTYFQAYRPFSLNPQAELARFRQLGVRTPSAPPAPDG